MLKIVKVCEEYLSQIESYRREMLEASSSFDGCNRLEKYEDISEWIDFCYALEKYETMPKNCNLIPAIEYLLIREEDNYLVGLFNCRLELNDYLLSFGGHIGYSIRPSERKKGYAKEGLKLILKFYQDNNYDSVLLTCYKHNKASAATIVSNGGIIENEVQLANEILQRYWIPLKYIVNDVEYKVKHLIGKGKGGYSYVANDGKKDVIIKKIHHEAYSCHNFGNKIRAERLDYDRIKATGIRMPKKIFIDEVQEIVVKEYIEGPSVMDLIEKGVDVSKYLSQVKEMASLAYAMNLNIDYKPNNFVVKDELVYYIDYECSLYSEENNFENWGILTWKK